MSDYSEQSCEDSSSRDYDRLVEAKRRADMKYQLLKKEYEEQLITFNEQMILDIVDKTSVKQYITSLHEQIKAKDERINHLNSNSEQQERKLKNLRDQFTDLKTRYFSLFKKEESIRLRLEQELKPISNNASDGSISFTSNVNDGSVPSPPPVDFDMDSIMTGIRSLPLQQLDQQQQNSYLTQHDNISTNTSQFNGIILNDSVPPPPEQDVDLEEIYGMSEHQLLSSPPPPGSFSGD